MSAVRASLENGLVCPKLIQDCTIYRNSIGIGSLRQFANVQCCSVRGPSNFNCFTKV